MKIYTNDNNTATLKLLIAANLAGKKIKLQTASFEDVSAGPKILPLLEVDEELSFFSSNAATQYLFPILDLSKNGQCQQMLEWEATRLQPIVASVLTSKSVPSDLKQALNSLLLTVEELLKEHQYILGDKLSSADISIWSTLYPLCYNKDRKQQYLAECPSITKWADQLLSAKAIQVE
ncbi:unnamed protein product [Euphydryas editha]|uniref:GST C-terminal domain-containing protein n=1 Tax=Euphydryas editha TaxID=104508 RepID=A0AAU9TEQ6_EUPED|nr:unnamed protein product [Euphydryas editha]